MGVLVGVPLGGLGGAGRLTVRQRGHPRLAPKEPDVLLVAHHELNVVRLVRTSDISLAGGVHWAGTCATSTVPFLKC